MNCITFQFTPLREGRRKRNTVSGLFNDFNSRPSARGDANLQKLRDAGSHFNSRPSARGDITHVLSAAILAISIHAPPRGATNQGKHQAVRHGYFNSRPSARGDIRARGKRVSGICISIHAPPRGATLAADKMRLDGHISIHAPPRGATITRPLSSSGFIISIHAPPRGATVLRGERSALGIFQFTLLREGRQHED